MAKLNIKMTYPVPDDGYLGQTITGSSTATLDYLGPDTIWIDVYKDGPKKGKWTHLPIKTNYLDDGDIEDYDNEDQTAAIERLPVPLDSERLKIDCTKDTHICALFAQPHCTGDDRGSYDKLPQTQDKLDDGTIYYERPRNDSIPPDHVWHRDSCVYDSASKTWDLVLQKVWTDWDEIRTGRNGLLDDTDTKTLLPDGPEKEKWETYRQELRDLPEKFAGKLPHTVAKPRDPEDEDNENLTSAGTPYLKEKLEYGIENPTEAPDPTAKAIPGA